MGTILKLTEYAKFNPEVIIVIVLLFGILSSLVGMLYFVIKAYISFKVKQEHCEGRFNRQRDDITGLREGVKEARQDSKEALKTVQKIEICTTKMQQTVEDIKTGYTNFIENKHGATNEEK